MMYARAWAYLECVVGPELGTVCSGLSTTALTIVGLLVNTLGDKKVLRDCCMSPLCCPTLVSGMGSQKVTIFFARAWVYLERVVGSLVGSVHSGLSTVAVTTLGACAVLGDCCKLPSLCPTLGSGMGSLKVTFFFFFTGTVVVLFKMSFIFLQYRHFLFPTNLNSMA